MALPEGFYRFKICRIIPEMWSNMGLCYRRITLEGIDADTGSPLVLSRAWNPYDGERSRAAVAHLARSLAKAGIRKSLRDLITGPVDLPVIRLEIASRFDKNSESQKVWAMWPCDNQNAFGSA